MKKQIPRLVLAGLLALSLSTASAVFAQVTRSGVLPPAACPSCSLDLGCPGSTCTCEYNNNGGHYCKPPTK